MIFKKFRFNRLIKRRERLSKKLKKLKNHWRGELYNYYVLEIKKIDRKLTSHISPDQIRKIKLIEGRIFKEIFI